MNRLAGMAVLALFTFALTGCGGGGDDSATTWSAKLNGDVLEIGYGRGVDYPQYAALHLDSSYFRVNCGPGTAWGTSVVMMPSFWEAGVYHQGASINHAYAINGSDLVISIEGTISSLHVSGEIRIFPPTGNTITAEVTMNTTGSVQLDNRPGEAFKPVMLSSMHISGDVWDAQSASIGSQTLAIPDNGWIADPPSAGTVLGLAGGTSTWKTNAPSIEITLDDSMLITGWVTSSINPNDDNVGFWPASDHVIQSWHYTVTVTSLPGEIASTDSSKCFIATAACGSESAPDVIVLRRFRDEVLRRNCAGRAFISAYELCAPMPARIIADSPVLRVLTRKLIVDPASFAARRLLPGANP